MDSRIDKERLKTFTMYYEAMKEQNPPVSKYPLGKLKRWPYWFLCLLILAIVVVSLYMLLVPNNYAIKVTMANFPGFRYWN